MQQEQEMYAVIFTSILNEDIGNAYTIMANRMVELAKQQPGFIAVNSARNNVGITVSYWEILAAIANWKKQEEHLMAQHEGKEKWYNYYSVKICKVVRMYASKQ
jgi:heme-degrading monooxygenase HmoA